MFAAVIPHFIVGAQKKIVFGPAGWLMKLLTAANRPDAMAASPGMDVPARSAMW
jgi:hypothetical protein